MHKSRHRKAKSAHKSRSPQSDRVLKQPPGPPPRPAADAPPFMLRPSAPAFPADLIVPAARGAVITATSWPQPVRKAAPARAMATDVLVAGRPAPAPPPAAEIPQSVSPIVTAPAPAVAPAAAPETASLPQSRALVVRRQGFIDILAFALRDSGRRLARWSSARRKAEEMKDKLARAEARMRAMEAQLAALRAIQERVQS